MPMPPAASSAPAGTPPLRESASAAALEDVRLAELYALDILDTPLEPQFDRIMELAARYFQVPFGSITFVDRHRQWFKAAVGLPHREGPLDQSTCAMTIQQDGVLVIENALDDPRSAHLDAVTGAPHVRFYAGAPVVTDSGQAIGTLCVMDQRPRHFSAEEAGVLAQFAQLVCSELRLRQVTQQLARQAMTDPLTGLPNRRAFCRLLDDACARAGDGSELVVGLLDLDEFKTINDLYGHAAGDEALGFLARQGRALLGPGETLARFGGDEFTLLLTGPEAVARAQAFAAALPGALQLPQAPIRGLRASLGLVQVGRVAGSEEVLRAADAAMYGAKASGGAQFVRLASPLPGR